MMLDRLSLNISPFTRDDELIESVTALKVPKFSCYVFPLTAVVAGHGSTLALEVDIEKIIKDMIPVYRRHGGGCSILLDKGTAVVSAAFPAIGFSRIHEIFVKCTRWLIKGLTRTGITGVYQDGVSDLVIDNHKIGGSCLRRSKGFAYFSAALLVNSDLSLMDKYLLYPPREPEYRNKRDHLDFVRNIDWYFPGKTAQNIVHGFETCLDPNFLTDA